MSANKMLLNARVRRLDGTVTYVNKINAHGYSTEAKGPQIPVKRIVFAGKMLKEIEQPFEKGEFAIVQGVAVKLNKKQQRDLANKELDIEVLKPEFGRLAFIDPETGRTTDGKKAPKEVRGINATRKQNGDTSTKKERKVEKESLSAEVDFLPSTKKERKSDLIDLIDGTVADANTKERRKLLSEAFDMDWKDVKAHGGTGVVKHMGRKAAQAACDRLRDTVTQNAFIKQMPAPLKRLIQDTELKLNQKQIELVLGALGLDTQFYAQATRDLSGKLVLAIDSGHKFLEGTVVGKKVERKPRVKKAQVAVYLPAAEQKRRMKKMSITLQAPMKKDVKELQKRIHAAKALIATKLGLEAREIKRGLVVYHKNGVEYMFVACDARGPIFIEKDGDPIVQTYDNVDSTFDLTLAKKSELDATV